MHRLFLGEAYRFEADVSSVVVNAQIKAPDDGQDGFTPAPKKSSIWLGNIETCWQFKSGKEGEPSKLTKEPSKQRPKEVLASGGRFVVVASGSVNGSKGRESRLKKLLKTAKELGLPTDKIEVYTSEQLTTWVNEYPAIIADLLGAPKGLISLQLWSNAQRHNGPFVQTDSILETLRQVRQELLYVDQTWHVHIYGLPGTGKTRLALELCRLTAWTEDVIYIGDGNLSVALELLSLVRDITTIRLLLVIENLSEKEILVLSDYVGLAKDRIRLITIGNKKQEVLHEGLRSIELTPLDKASSERFLKELFPKMLRDHRKYIVNLSAGFVRLLFFFGKSILENPNLITADSVYSQKRFMQIMLGDRKNYAPLLAVALFESLGWKGIHAEELQIVVEHLGLNLADVKVTVCQFDEDFGIAPLSGDFRHISPPPLAVFLAQQAWESWGDLISKLGDKLSLDASTRFYARWKIVAAGEGVANEYAKKALYRFSSLSDLMTENNMFQWSCLAVADPIKALCQIRKELENASYEILSRLSSKAKAELIWTLENFIKNTETFDDSILALASLVEIEKDHDERATNLFLLSFSPFLGGTSRPYNERLPVLDSLLKQGDKYRKLVIRALTQAGERNVTRVEGNSLTERANEPEWEPRPSEYYAPPALALTRLAKMATERISGYEKEFFRAARTYIWLILVQTTQQAYIEFIKELFQSDIFESENLELEIETFLNKSAIKHKSHPVFKSAQKAFDQLQNPSPESRLRFLMFKTEYFENPPSKALQKCASDLLHTPSLLWKMWHWLTSGKSFGPMSLGIEIGQLDKDGSLFSLMLKAPDRGQDESIIAGYLLGYCHVVGQEIVEDLIDGCEGNNLCCAAFLVELTHRVSKGDRGAKRITRLLKSSAALNLPLKWISHVKWERLLSDAVFLELLDELSKCSEYRAEALAFLSAWIKLNSDRWPVVENIALCLVCDPLIIRSGEDMLDLDWAFLASRLLPSHARIIACSIIEAHGYRDKKIWFANRPASTKILSACLKHDPQGVRMEIDQKMKNEAAASFYIGFPVLNESISD